MGAIGDFLWTRTTEQEDALLTGRLRPYAISPSPLGACLLGHGNGGYGALGTKVAVEFDCLCQRLGGGQSRHMGDAPGYPANTAYEGVERAAQMIRARIWRNRGKRLEVSSREPVEALVG